MQYQTLLVAALAGSINAAATPSQLTLAYGTVSADVTILSNDIAFTGPSTSSVASYKKAYSDLEILQVATGDTLNHPCPVVKIIPVKTKKQAEDYIEKTEEIATSAFKGALKGQPGTQICQATQYLSAVGQYVGASA